MSDKDVYSLVQLSPADAEYMTVSQEFLKTCSRQIVKVGGFIIPFGVQLMLRSHVAVLRMFFVSGH